MFHAAGETVPAHMAVAAHPAAHVDVGISHMHVVMPHRAMVEHVSHRVMAVHPGPESPEQAS